MPLALGNKKVKRMYLGTKEVKKAYLGTKQIYPEQIENGVYILHTNGNLYTQDEWNTSDNTNAVGVAVITENCRFVIAPESSVSELKWCRSNVNESIEGLDEVDKETAKLDYNGYSNTLKIVKTLGESTDYAAGFCRNYTLKNGMKGYLGSVGEWNEAYKNKDKIQICMSLIGAEPMDIGGYWSSNVSFGGAYYLSWVQGGEISGHYQYYDSYYARPFCQL